MTLAVPDIRRRFAIAPLVVFPLVGPIAPAAIVALPLALIGLLALGPGGILYYLFLAGWWSTFLYPVLAPPFFLAGVLVALAGRIGGRCSLPVALLCVELAFAAFVVLWLWPSGALTPLALGRNDLNALFLLGLMAVMVVVVGTLGAWWILQRIDRREPAIGGLWQRHAAILPGAAIAGAVSLGGLLVLVARLAAA